MIRRPVGPDAAATFTVRAAALLVPRTRRAAWIAEWKAELWHAQHSRLRRPSPFADPVEFSLGAWRDALWLRGDQLRNAARKLLQPGSAERCLLLLSGAALAALLVCLCLPGARRVLLPLPYPDPANLAVISSRGDEGIQTPSIRYTDYREWTHDTSGLFTQLAWYRPVTKGIYLAQHRPAHLTVAESSDNLLQVLGLAVPSAVRQTQDFQGPRLILTRSAWRRAYRGDPRVVGQIANIDGRAVRIAGVLPDRDWHLPGAIDGLLLEDAAGLATLAPHARGIALARVRTSAFPPARNGWRWMTEARYGTTRRYEVIEVGYLDGMPMPVFAFVLILAFLALPATTALPLGDYPRPRGRLPRTRHALRWLFFAAKFSLIVPTVYLASLAFVCACALPGSVLATYLELAVSFPALLLAFRWILVDQRRRCPECLRRLSNPARVGQPSCNFLAWNGTELFCARGHGLLHIPELATSWFSTQRWLCLDASWRSLFADSTTPSAEIV